MFASFSNIEIVQVIEVLRYGKQKPSFSHIINATLLMAWRDKDPGILLLKSSQWLLDYGICVNAFVYVCNTWNEKIKFSCTQNMKMISWI